MLETAGGILLAVFILFVLLRFLPEILQGIIFIASAIFVGALVVAWLLAGG